MTGLVALALTTGFALFPFTDSSFRGLPRSFFACKCSTIFLVGVALCFCTGFNALFLDVDFERATFETIFFFAGILSEDLALKLFFGDFEAVVFLADNLFTPILLPEEFAVGFDPFLVDLAVRFAGAENAFPLVVCLAVFLEYFVAILY
jgi:hypothetical protein